MESPKQKRRGSSRESPESQSTGAVPRELRPPGRFAAFSEITTAVTSTLDLRSVLDILMEKIDLLLPYAATFVWLKRPGLDVLDRVACRNISEVEWRERQLYETPSILRTVIETGKPVVVRNLHGDTRVWDPAFFRRHGLCSYLGVPLKAKGEILGVLSFMTREERHFSSKEIEFLQTIAGQAAVAIHNSQLYEQVQKKSEQLATVHTLTAEVNESLDLDPVLEKVTKRITEIFHFDATRVFFLDSKGEELHRWASFDTYPELFSSVNTFKLGQGFVGQVASTGEPVIFENTKTDPRYLKGSQTKVAAKIGYCFFGLLPIKSHLRTVGVLLCIGRRPRSLTEDEIQLLTSVANQIGVAFEKSALFRETKEKAGQLSTLYSVATAMNSSLDLNLTLRNAMKEGLKIFKFDAARIYLYERNRQKLVLTAHEGFPAELTIPDTYEPGEGFIGRVFESGEPTLFEDARTDRLFHRFSRKRVMYRAGYRSQFFVPIGVRGRVLGTLNFLSRSAHRFTPGEVELIHSIASHLGVAVEHAWLFREVGQRAQELESLVKVNSNIAALIDRDLLLPQIAEEARKVLDVSLVTVRLIEGKATRRVAYAGAYRSTVSDKELPLAEGLPGTVISEDRVISVRDLTRTPVEAGEGELRGYKSFLGLPVKLKDRIIGTLSCYTEQEREFSAQEVGMMSGFAGQAAIAIENADLFTQIRNKATELERVNADLQEANRAKSDFMNAMSHELRTPLHVIMGYTDLLTAGLGGSINGPQKDALEAVRHQSEALLTLIGNVLTLARIEARKMTLDVSRQPLAETLRHVREYVSQLNQDDRLEFFWEMDEVLPMMATDHMKLEEILQNLIGNAYKYTPQGSILVRVKNLSENARVEFTIADNGNGISEADLERIFEAFYQSREAHTGERGGVGLGLSIVKRYIDMMQGEIRVDSRLGAGTTFTFQLPWVLGDAECEEPGDLRRSSSPTTHHDSP